MKFHTFVQGQCATSDIDDGTNNYSAPAPLVPNAAHDNGADLHGPQVALVSERAQNLTTPQMVKFFLDKPPIKLITTGGNHSLALLGKLKVFFLFLSNFD